MTRRTLSATMTSLGLPRWASGRWAKTRARRNWVLMTSIRTRWFFAQDRTSSSALLQALKSPSPIPKMILFIIQEIRWEHSDPSSAWRTRTSPRSNHFFRLPSDFLFWYITNIDDKKVSYKVDFKKRKSIQKLKKMIKKSWKDKKIIQIKKKKHR